MELELHQQIVACKRRIGIAQPLIDQGYGTGNASKDAEQLLLEQELLRRLETLLADVDKESIAGASSLQV